MASSSEAYSSTPVHIKTLDILGQTKPFNKLTYAHLERFIDLAVKHYGCVEENETIDFLASRYGWDASMRALDLSTAWRNVMGIKTEPNCSVSAKSKTNCAFSDLKNSSPVAPEVSSTTIKPRGGTPLVSAVKHSRSKSTKESPTAGPAAYASANATKRTSKIDKKSPALSRPPIDTWNPIDTQNQQQSANDEHDGSKTRVSGLPVVVKSSAAKRPILLCQMDDEKLQFIGDSGAIGRLFCSEDAVRLDLKGRQYSGTLIAGPTVMILNLAPPVAQSTSTSSIGSGSAPSLVARVETITNEFCHLNFQKDLHSNMQGVYTGFDSTVAGGGFEGDSPTLQKRSKAQQQQQQKGKRNSSSKNKSKDKSGMSVAVPSESTVACTSAAAVGGVKISTITQRKTTKTGKAGKSCSGSSSGSKRKSSGGNASSISKKQKN